MKKFKLFLAAMAALVTMGVQAQSWTVSEVGEGYFMLYNVGTGQYLTKGNGWGTQASITTAATVGNGLAVELITVGDNFKIRTGINNDAYGLENLSGGTVYTDQSRDKNSTWTFTQVGTDNGPVYNIVSADNHGGGSGAYLTAGVDGTIVTPGNDGTIDGAKWKLMSIPAQPIGMDDATEDNPVDATSLIVNANFSFPSILKSGTGSWSVNASNNNLCGGDVTNPCGESWRSAFTISQALSVPNGIYEVTAQAALSDYAHLYDGANYPVVFANSAEAFFKEMEEADRETSMTQLSGSFTNGKYVVGPIRVVVTNGTLTIGVRGTRIDTWCIWDNFRLTYKGVDLSALKEALQAQIDAVPDLEGTTTAAAYNAAKNYADGIDVASLNTEDAISAASTELANRVNAAKALQSAYAGYLAIKSSVDALDDDASIFTGDATIDLSEEETEAEAATTVEALTAAVAKLKIAATSFVTSVTVNEGKYFDMTNLWIVNPTVSQNVEGWKSENVVRAVSWGTGPTTNYGETEFYQSTFDFNQEVTLPRGTFEFGVTGFHRAGDHSTYFYAGDDKILIPGVESSVVDNMAQAKTYFDEGNGKVALKFGLEDESNTIKIGILNQDTETDRWTIFRNFTILYYGSTVDYSIYAAQWEDAKDAAVAAKTAHSTITSGDEYTALNTAIADEPDDSWKKADYLAKIETLTDATSAFIAAATIFEAWPTAVAAANTAKTNNPNVTGIELTDLNTAIADEPEANDKVSYEEKTTALTNATNVFTAAAPSYNQYAAYKAETEALWGSALGVAEPTTAAEAIVAVQNLNIAQYNKVAEDYKYSLTSKIGDFSTWTGTATVAGEDAKPNYLDWEHYSGTQHPYYEQAASGWNNANGWTVHYEKKCTLPAGSYVIKVAARSSADVTSSITITANDETIAPVISLPSAGNNTRGINTDGEASWDSEDMFIRTGGLNNEDPTPAIGYSGAGWQWRFVPFTLDEETEVTMTFYAEASSQYQWMSIADGELRSTANIATAVAYNETADNTITDVDLANVTITRNIKEGFNTVVLPFDLTLGQVEAAFGTGTQVYAFSEESTDPKRAVIYFNKVNAGTISANVPVLLKATVESNEQVFEGVEVVAPTEDVKVEGTNFDFVGVYAPATVEKLDYFIGNGAIYKSEGKTNINAFRAFIDNKSPEITGEVKMFIDGLETAISEINDDATVNGTIYNLAGQRVNKAQKGIFIVNGKKVIIK